MSDVHTYRVALSWSGSTGEGYEQYDRTHQLELPPNAPAIVASAAIVFAISIDDFVISQWLSNGANTSTVPMLIYDATRSTPIPSTDGIATVIMLITLASVVAGVMVYRFFTRGEGGMQHRQPETGGHRRDPLARCPR